MKKLTVLILLALGMLSKPALADEYPTILGIGGDKYLHFGVSAGLTGMIYLVMSAPSRLGDTRDGRIPALIGSSVFAFGLGLAKEVMDANGGPLDGGDLAADALGVAAMATTIYFLDIHNFQPKNTKIGFDGRRIQIGWRF